MRFQAVVELLSHSLSLGWDLIPNCQSIPGFTCRFTCRFTGHYQFLSHLVTDLRQFCEVVKHGEFQGFLATTFMQLIVQLSSTLRTSYHFVLFIAYKSINAYNILLFCVVLCTMEPRPGTTWTMFRTSASLFLADCLSEIGSSCKEPQGLQGWPCHGDPGWLLQNYPKLPCWPYLLVLGATWCAELMSLLLLLLIIIIIIIMFRFFVTANHDRYYLLLWWWCHPNVEEVSYPG